MKIAVIGVGAMGSIYSGMLSEAGNEVWSIDLWREHVDEIGNNGLRVEGTSGDRIISSLKASTNILDAGKCDMYIIATKVSGVASAAEAISRVVGADSIILTIQNGLGAIEQIADHLQTNNLLLGVADGFGASIKGPGYVHHNAMNLIRIGELNGGLTQRLKNIVQIWRDAGFVSQAFPDIDQLIWEKFLCNVTASAPCAVFQCTLGGLINNPCWWHIATSCMEEAYEIGCAKNINFSFDDAETYVAGFIKKMPNARPSMLLDHLAGRKSEIDAINGMVPVLGKELGIETPYNDVMIAAVREQEKNFNRN